MGRPSFDRIKFKSIWNFWIKSKMSLFIRPGPKQLSPSSYLFRWPVTNSNWNTRPPPQCAPAPVALPDSGHLRRTPRHAGHRVPHPRLCSSHRWTPPPLLHVPPDRTPSHFSSPARVPHSMRTCRAPTRCCRSSSLAAPHPDDSRPLRPLECTARCQILPICRPFLPHSVSTQHFTKFLQSMNYSPSSCSLGDSGAGRGH
jgi:hypothetical protein